MPLEAIDTNWLRRFRKNLTCWYAKHARQLPWRETRDPYHIWISEIMLQQTTVAAVKPYFERFLGAFPNLDALAKADEHDVLKLWEGLGYYSRARNLHRAARQLIGEFDGQFPQLTDELQALPGIGRYTAGAISSFAFDTRAPIVEANTLRLYCRLLGFEGDPRSTEGQRILWEFAETILPRKHAGLFNQALMELGGTLCSISEPACPKCPVRSCCVAFTNGSQSSIPRPARRPETTRVVEATVAVRKGKEVLLRQRQEGERWAGLWDFPRFPVDDASDKFHSWRGEGDNKPLQAQTVQLATQLEARMRETLGLSVRVGRMLTVLHHGVTRYRIALVCFLAEFEEGKLHSRGENLQWISPGKFSDFPLSVTGRKFAKLLENSQIVDNC